MNYPFPIYDAHNHLQDTRLASQLDSIVRGVEAVPVRKMVVNGTRPEDWPRIAELAGTYDWILPSYGVHPWYVNQICENWRATLEPYLRERPAAVGEIGLDRWIEDHDPTKQEAAFIWQLRLAAELDRPVSIHCLKAWGRLLEILTVERLPSCGFLLHSYGGPVEMVQSFVELGGYFSLSGYFGHERKNRQREVFAAMPLERVLLETDAPDMTPPSTHMLHFLSDAEGNELNHPANIPAVYELAAEIYRLPMEELAMKVEENFRRLFAPVLEAKSVALRS